MSERGDSWCTETSSSSLLVKLSQVFESALLYSILKLAAIPFACAHFPISSFQSTLHLICFDTALLEQSPLSVMTLCDLPSLWRVSVIAFWTITKSAVFPIIVVSKNKRYPEFILYEWSLLKLKCKYSIFLRYWMFLLSCAVSSNHQVKKPFEMFYFTCNESRIHESLTIMLLQQMKNLPGSGSTWAT